MVNGKHQQKGLCYLILVLLFLHQSSATVVTAIQTGITKLAETFNFGTGFVDFADTALSVLGAIPDFINGLINKNSEVIKKLDQVLNALDTISRVQRNIWNDIQTLSRDLQFTVIQNTIADDSKEIQNCMISYRGYLSGKFTVYEDELKNCNLQASVRSVGRILKGEEVSVKGSRLVDGLLNKDGYCEGHLFSKVYGYLLRLLFEGYELIIVSQQLKSCNDDTKEAYISEYKELLKGIIANIQKDLRTCSDCKAVTKHLQQKQEAIDPPSTLKQLASYFPWNRFYIFKFKNNVATKLSDFGTEVNVYKVHQGNEMLQIFSFTYIDSTPYKPQQVQLDMSLLHNQPHRYCPVLKVEYNKVDLISKHGDRITLQETSASSEISTLEAYCYFRNDAKKGLGSCQDNVAIDVASKAGTAHNPISYLLFIFIAIQKAVF